MKSNRRACRHCHSPARGNPCWWWIDHQYDGGADAPCDGYVEYAPSRWGRRILTFACAVAIVVIVALLVV